MGGFAGGSPDHLSAAGKGLTSESGRVGDFSIGINRAKQEASVGAAGSAVDAAMARFAAAYGGYTDGVRVEVAALGKLASVTGADIAAATGPGYMPGPGRGVPQ